MSCNWFYQESIATSVRTSGCDSSVATTDITLGSILTFFVACLIFWSLWAHLVFQWTKERVEKMSYLNNILENFAASKKANSFSTSSF